MEAFNFSIGGYQNDDVGMIEDKYGNLKIYSLKFGSRHPATLNKEEVVQLRNALNQWLGEYHV